MNDVLTVASPLIALAALLLSVVSTRHASRSARAAEAAARSAELSAEAEVLAAAIDQQRFEREQIELARQAEADTAAREAVEQEQRSAKIQLYTTRTPRERPPTFGDAEQYDYWLVVANNGYTMAERVRISNISCNGYGKQDMPAQALDASELSPRVGLLARRDWRIKLVKSGDRSTYDLAFADVAWSDGNGDNRARLPIERQW